MMNKARGQKKDVTRTLKAMKLQQSAGRYLQCIKDNNTEQNSIQTKNISKIIYSSNNNKKLKQRRYRVDRMFTQNQIALTNNNRIQPKSLDLKSTTNYLKVSQRYKQDFTHNSKNPYMSRNGKTNTTVKQVRRSLNLNLNQVPRRNTSQQSISPHPQIMMLQKTIGGQPMTRKTFNFNTIDCKIPVNINNLMQQASMLAGQGSISQSESILQRILREDPQNKQALYLSGTNNYKQMNYLKSIYFLNNLLELDPLYNKNAYIMSSMCYSNKGQKQQAMLRINACISFFPDFYDAHFQKAKLYLKQDDPQNAIKSFKKALKLAKNVYQCCLKLGECYEKQNMYELAIKIYDKVTKAPDSKQNYQQKLLCILRKAQCQKKLVNFKDYVQSLKLYLKLIDNNTIQSIAKINYQIGYGYYKINDYPSAIMKLQQVFGQKSKKESTDALILITLINIKKRDFYQAHHCLLRKQHLQINQNQLSFYEKFCQGVLCLMKRKFQIGLQKLLQIESQVSEICKQQFHQQISKIYPLYLSYAYFCYGRTDKCIKINQKLLKQNIPELVMYNKGIQFNLCLCLGIQQFKNKKFSSAKNHFTKSTEIYSHKPQGYLYLGITLIHMYLKDYNEILLKKSKHHLVSCLENLKQLNNNYAASAFYVKALLSSFMGEWDSAISQIDECIERAQDNEAKSFYLRALILSCCHNYKQAISQVSIAMSLNNNDGNYYLLRSKCQQIQGDGNSAFLDLQQYISRSPEDANIHKYAGHLLFQNGAFEDALQAYENGEIAADIANYDVFLTRAKTHFLLGQFQKSANDMAAANKIKGEEDPNINFDICIINILHQFFSHFSAALGCERAQRAKQQFQNLAAVGQDIDYGKIFKKIQISMLISVFLFYMGRYRQASRQFKQTFCMKQENILNNQSQYEQQLKQKQFFVAQMHYNRAICYLMMSQQMAAVKQLQKCQLQQGSKTAIRLQQLIGVLKGKKTDIKTFQIFSQKSKMSKSLNEVTIKLSNNQSIKLKLSIPFPKVQPPDINPTFQIRLLRQINLQSIEKKPEAPWILRQLDSIKFTQKIQQFSRLDMNNSELTIKGKMKNQGLKQSQQSEDEQQFDELSQTKQVHQCQGIEELKQKLKLDQKIEDKIKKIISKNTKQII